MTWFFLGALFGGLAVLIAAHARRELAAAVADALAADDLPADDAPGATAAKRRAPRARRTTPHTPRNLETDG